MRQAVIILVLLAAIAFCSCGSARGDYIEVRDVTMRLEGDRATFDLNYTLDTFARLYVLALGARQLEPDLISLDNCYLFYSRPFGSKDRPLKRGVERLSVVYPGGKVDTFYNVNSTQNVFYEAD